MAAAPARTRSSIGTTIVLPGTGGRRTVTGFYASATVAGAATVLTGIFAANTAKTIKSMIG